MEGPADRCRRVRSATIILEPVGAGRRSELIDQGTKASAPGDSPGMPWPLPLALFLATAPPSPCPAKGPALVVETSAHRLVLCEDGVALRSFEVAIGQNGPAPRRVGWAQTPLGRFTLAAPRPSKQFHVFVPLVNPDPKRFSAWAIGLHGPQRGWEQAGHVNVESDWTLGCIAVSSDEEIDEIARWVRARNTKRIEIR